MEMFLILPVLMLKMEEYLSLKLMDLMNSILDPFKKLLKLKLL